MLPILIALGYPLLVYFALDLASPRAIALAILALYALRLATLAKGRLAAYARIAGPVAVAITAASAISLVWNDPRGLLLSPALVNLALLAVFAASLASRETVIESLALAHGAVGSEELSAYCQKVTAIWCALFAANAGVSAWLALFGTRASWALYTGLVAYLLMGLLFATEFVYRHWRFRRYVGLPTDPLLRRLFPPDPTK